MRFNIVLVLSLLLNGCMFNEEFEAGFVYDNIVTEENYKKTPCIVDGQTVKPKKKKKLSSN